MLPTKSGRRDQSHFQRPCSRRIIQIFKKDLREAIACCKNKQRTLAFDVRRRKAHYVYNKRYDRNWTPTWRCSSNWRYDRKLQNPANTHRHREFRRYFVYYCIRLNEAGKGSIEEGNYPTHRIYWPWSIQSKDKRTTIHSGKTSAWSITLREVLEPRRKVLLQMPS